MENKVTKKVISLVLIVTGRYNFNPNSLNLYINHGNGTVMYRIP